MSGNRYYRRIGDYEVWLRPAASSWVRRFFALFWTRKRRWMTYRLPFQKRIWIVYPKMVDNPEWYPSALEHENYHADELAKRWALLKHVLLLVLVPLPVFFSGRWLIERYAYLQDIHHGYLSVEEAVQTLWWQYGFCWPRPLMRKWFMKKMEIIE